MRPLVGNRNSKYDYSDIFAIVSLQDNVDAYQINSGPQRKHCGKKKKKKEHVYLQSCTFSVHGNLSANSEDEKSST